MTDLLDASLSLQEGGLLVWPSIEADPLSHQMLIAFCHTTGIPIDVPVGKLTPSKCG